MQTPRGKCVLTTRCLKRASGERNNGRQCGNETGNLVLV